MSRLLASLVLLLACCTVRVDAPQVPQPKITIQCLIVTLGGQAVVTDCDAGSDGGQDGGTDAAALDETSVSVVGGSSATSGPPNPAKDPTWQ